MTKETADVTDKDLDPTPETGDKFLNADVMLRCGVTISRVLVIECKRDADGKHVGKSNDKPILDPRHYLVDFEDD